MARKVAENLARLSVRVSPVSAPGNDEAASPRALTPEALLQGLSDARRA